MRSLASASPVQRRTLPDPAPATFSQGDVEVANSTTHLDDSLIDKYEVTNRDFKKIHRRRRLSQSSILEIPFRERWQYAQL